MEYSSHGRDWYQPALKLPIGATDRVLKFGWDELSIYKSGVDSAELEDGMSLDFVEDRNILPLTQTQ